MANMLGNLEVDEYLGYVRLKLAENDYEYLISQELYGSQAQNMVKAFVIGHGHGVINTRNHIKEAIGL